MDIDILFKQIEINDRVFNHQIKAHRRVTEQFNKVHETNGTWFNLWNIKELGRLKRQCDYHFINLQKVQEENKIFIVLIEKEVNKL